MTLFGREPAVVISTLLSVLQIVGILWANDWNSQAVDPQLWSLPALTFGGGFGVRSQVTPVAKLKQTAE